MTSQTIGVPTFVYEGGDVSECWNLVLVAEGYTKSEIDSGKWAGNAASFVDVMQGMAPFNEEDILHRYNVLRVDTISADSGADDPLQCNGSGLHPATTFDASYCNFNLRRLLKVNEYRVRTALASIAPWRHKVLVVVNDSAAAGGSGGPIAVSTNGPSWQAIAMHELGHSFGLADEYDYYQGCHYDSLGHDHFGANLPEPICPNITKNRDPLTVKWSALLDDPATAPVVRSTDCGRCHNGYSLETRPGIFEGAAFHHCGIFRPSFNCKMRKFTTPYFCVVCADHIRQTLLAFGPQGS